MWRLSDWDADEGGFGAQPGARPWESSVVNGDTVHTKPVLLLVVAEVRHAGSVLGSIY